MTNRRWIAAAVAAVALAAAALSPVARADDPIAAVDPALRACDPVDPAHCLLPFPSDWHTVADESTDTGRRVDLSAAAMPRNVAGKPIDPTEWNRNDGFSPGTPVLARVPGLDLHQTWGEPGDHLEDLSWYERTDAPILVINADTGERHPFWSELDTHPDTSDDQRLLILRPAVNFEEGARYLVALRDLRDASGATIPAPEGFAHLRDGTAPAVPDPVLEARRPSIDRIIDELTQAEPGLDPSELHLAWELTIASERNLAERALTMRDTTFEMLGDSDPADRVIEGDVPPIRVTSVQDFTPAQNRGTARRVELAITVPNFLTPQVQVEDPALPARAALPGSRINYGPDGLPAPNPAQPTVEFKATCQLPRSATAADPAHPYVYGHGLLGSRGEANGGSTEDLRLRNFAVCATDWWGMSSADLPNVATILADVSNFPTLADRSQQGMLHVLALARALAHPDGIAALPEMAGPSGERLIDSSYVDYVGNSQGGIMGGAVAALSPDFRRAVLGVPGMNYSTLLNRSVDWEGAYAVPFYAAYPSKLEQQIVFGLLQMLWDRAEANGYAHHMSHDPYEGMEPRQVMLQVAFADHQVANVSAEVEARTIGAAMQLPAVRSGLHWSDHPAWGMDTVSFSPGGVWVDGDGEPVHGSVLVYWYSPERGLTTPPNGNTPPRAGSDPHEDPRRDNAASDGVARFLRTGELIDVCGGAPCETTAASRAN